MRQDRDKQAGDSEAIDTKRSMVNYKEKSEHLRKIMKKRDPRRKQGKGARNGKSRMTESMGGLGRGCTYVSRGHFWTTRQASFLHMPMRQSEGAGGRLGAVEQLIIKARALSGLVVALDCKEGLGRHTGKAMPSRMTS